MLIERYPKINLDRKYLIALIAKFTELQIKQYLEKLYEHN